MTELQQRKHQEAPHPTWVSVARMYRVECGLSFDEARQRATNEFSKRGWDTPTIEQERIKQDAVLFEEGSQIEQ